MELTKVTQSEVSAGGDVVAGNKTVNNIQQPPGASGTMQSLLKRWREGACSSAFDGKFIGELSLHIGENIDEEDSVGLVHCHSTILG
jgi:hypothetical protein